MNTYYGTKDQMTQIWDKLGVRYTATLVKVRPLHITYKKSKKKDGYPAIQVGFGNKQARKISKPLKGHLKKTGKQNKYPRILKEICLDQTDIYKIGDVIRVEDVLSPGDQVNVSGISKGRGFTGVIKRWGFHGGPRTHGQSDRERAPGSIGQGTDPGRVHKGKKMPGRFGNQKFTIRNLTVLYLDSANQEIALSGPIPGSKNSLITIKKTGSGEPLDLILDNLDNNKKPNKKNSKPSEEKSTGDKPIQPKQPKQPKPQKPSAQKETNNNPDTNNS